MQKVWRNGVTFTTSFRKSIANKPGKMHFGPILKSQWFGCAKDLANAIPLEILYSDEGAQHIANAIYTRDPLSVVCEVFIDLTAQLSNRSHHGENVKHFESRFSAQILRFRSH